MLKNAPTLPEHVIGFARELGGGYAVCAEHAAVWRPDPTLNRRLLRLGSALGVTPALAGG